MGIHWGGDAESRREEERAASRVGARSWSVPDRSEPSSSLPGYSKLPPPPMQPEPNRVIDERSWDPAYGYEPPQLTGPKYVASKNQFPAWVGKSFIDQETVARRRRQEELRQQNQPSGSFFETLGKAWTEKDLSVLEGYEPTSQDIGFGLGSAMGGTPFGLGMYGARALAEGLGSFFLKDLNDMTTEEQIKYLQEVAARTTKGTVLKGPGGYTVQGKMSLEDTFGYLDDDRPDNGGIFSNRVFGNAPAGPGATLTPPLLLGEQSKGTDAYAAWLALLPEKRYSEEGVELLKKAGRPFPGLSVEKLAQTTGITVEQAQASLESMYPQDEFVAAKGGIVNLQGGGEIVASPDPLTDVRPRTQGSLMQYTQPKYQGEPTIASLANGLGTLGRYGDSYMVHAAEGETVVPAEILAANPELKNHLFGQMRMMGIPDPDRYVVGNTLNSINPITGQPEFFFKKIFKALKKVAKKILPIAAPIIGNLIAPGIGGILASGLVTKLQGGSWGDAAKSAAISYGLGALGRGVQGGIAGLGQEGTGFVSGFGTGLGRGLTDPFSAASNLFTQGPLNPLAQGVFGPRGTGWAFPSLADTDFAGQQFGGGPGVMNRILPGYQSEATLRGLGIDPATGAALAAQSISPPPVSAVGGGAPKMENLATSRQSGINVSGGPAKMGVGALTPTPASATDWMSMRWNTPADAALDLPPSLRNIKLVFAPGGGVMIDPGATFEVPKAPGFFKQHLGETAGAIAEGVVSPVGAAFLTAAVVYALSPEEQSVARQLEDLALGNPDRRDYDLWKSLPDKNTAEAQQLKAKWYGQPAYTAFQLASSFGANPLPGITLGTPGAPTGIQAALGGEVMGLGTGTSDSIPARLSDGEFVMTAQAVRNAGGGNRNLGAARMYDMMNRFERGVA